MFLYWYSPSLAMWLFLSSTHSSRYFSMIGSWIFCHVRCFLLLMTSYSASRALCFLPTSMNSEIKVMILRVEQKDQAEFGIPGQNLAYRQNPTPVFYMNTCNLILPLQIQVFFFGFFFFVCFFAKLGRGLRAFIIWKISDVTLEFGKFLEHSKFVIFLCVVQVLSLIDI